MKIINNIKNILGLNIKNKKYSLKDDQIFGKVATHNAPSKWIKSTCGYCGVGCGLYIGVKNGKPILTKGDPKHKVNRGTLCPKGLSQHKMVQSSNRLNAPMIRKEGELKEVSWDEAFIKVSDKFKLLQKKYGKNSVACISTGQLLTEEFYTLGKFVQLGLATNNYDGNTTLCMSSAVMGHKQTFGSDGPIGCYDDFSHADVIMLLGANISDNHPILNMHIKRNEKITGKKPIIIVVDPRYSKTANLADIFVPLNPRSDLALVNGLCHIILKEGWQDKSFIKNRTSGFDKFETHIMDNYVPKRVSEITGIKEKELYTLAKTYSQVKNAMSAWTMGINQSSIGTDTVSAICNLALITGNVGRKGASALSITGQCNAMGTRETGFTSSIPGYRDFNSLEDRKDYANIIGIDVENIPTKRGYTYPQIIDAINKGEIKALWLVATNPLVSFPNQKKLRDALNKLDLLIVQDAFKSETVEIADVVFSAATWSEKEGTYTNSERRCNIAKKANEPLGFTKSDFNIVLEFSKYFENKNELLFKNWTKPEDAFNEWKKVSAGRLCDYSGMKYDLIEKHGGIQWPCNETFPLGKDRLYDEKMLCNTKDGKANLLVVNWEPLVEESSKEYPFILNTGRTVEQWHTRTKTKTINILNDLAPEAWVEINPKDATLLRVKNHERVHISSKRGEIKDILVKVISTVKQGSIFVPFHYNEQLINSITIDDFDAKSFEPNYKQCAVQIHSDKVPQGIQFEEK